tara:strand:+ start:348 stop:1244 length:897 start_codon:yes stop_codon:yes gene_type:complete
MTDLHIASLSGGKDSVAACLHLNELGIPHRRVFMDTGWEHPTLYSHLDYLEAELGPIERIGADIPTLPAHVLPDVLAIESLVGVSPSAFVRWTVRKGMFPSRTKRFCTQELKVRPFLRWVEGLDADVVNIVGIRAQESAARAKLPERELMPGAEHIEVWRPLIRWTEEDVIAIHQRHNVRPCPLYLEGSSRVGCWPCIHANKGQLQQLGHDAGRLAAIRLLEGLLERLAKQRDPDNNGPTMFSAATRLADGSRPPVAIDAVMEWAQTKRGGKQMALDTAWGRQAGCVRWGMCDVGDQR